MPFSDDQIVAAITGDDPAPVPAGGGRFSDEAIEQAIGADPRFKVATRQGLVQNPEEAARILRVQHRFSLPADLIQRNLPQLEQEMQRVDFDPETFRAQSPVVAQWLAEQPERMAISKDDLPNLARLEALVATSPRYTLTAAGGVNELSPDGKTGIAYDSAQDFFAREYRGREVRRQLDEGERRKRVAELVETFGPMANVAAGAFASVGATLEAVQVGPTDDSRFAPVRQTTQASVDLSPGIWGDLQRGAGGLAADVPLMLAGGPLARGVGALGKLGRMRTLLQTAAAVQPLAIREGINTGREQGAWNGLAAWGIETAVPAAFGRTGVERALIPGLAPEVMAKRVSAARRLLVDAGLEGTEEAATEFVHAIHEAASGINPDALEGDQLARRLIVAGALGAAAGTAFNVPELLAAPAAGQQGADGTPGRTQAQAIPGILRGLNTKQFMQELGDVAATSKAAQRSPEAVEQLVAQLGDAGRKEIYVDPVAFTEYAQGKGLNARDFARTVTDPGVYEEAVATGAPMPIPVATYFKVIAGSDHHAALSALAKLSPSDPSVAEAEAQQAEILAPREPVTPEQRQAAEAAAASLDPTADPADASAQRIQEDVQQQLEASGMRPAEARIQGLLYREFFATEAKRAGKDPFAVYEPYRLRIVRQLPGVVQKGTTDLTDTLLDRLRAGEIPTEAQIRGESLLEYLRRKGGLQDQGGELSYLDANAKRKPGQRNLVREDGLSLDDAAMAAAEQGYIEEATPNALLDALRGEIGGAPVYIPGQENADQQALREGLVELQDYLGRLGIDLKTASNAEVKAALAAHEAKLAEGGQEFAQDQPEMGDVSHLSVRAQAYLASLSPEVRADLVSSVDYLRKHPDPDGDLGNLQMLVMLNKRAAAKTGRSYNQSGEDDWIPPDQNQYRTEEEKRPTVANAIESLAKVSLWKRNGVQEEVDWSKREAAWYIKGLGMTMPEFWNKHGDAITERTNALVSEYAAHVAATPALDGFREALNSGNDYQAREVLKYDLGIDLEEEMGRSYDQGGERIRGKIQIQPDRSIQILLTPNANRSTFLHESGHLFLEVMADLSSAPDATPEIAAQWAEIQKWLGVEKRSQIGVKEHEQFAEGFETYLMEGRAPSAALRSAFARFKAWLLSIYRSLAGMRIQLNPEVRRMFDRLLATDEAIAAALGRQGTAPTFATAADAGMTDEQFAAYQASVEAARENADDRLRGQVMRVFQREATKAWQEERDRVRETTAAEIDAKPEYQALRALQAGRMPDGSPTAIKLNRQEILDTYGSEGLNRLPGPSTRRRLNPSNRGRTVYADDGISLQAAAAIFGFRDRDALYYALVNAQDRTLLTEQTTSRIMAERYPDPLMDGSIDEKASLALHNDMAADVLVAELRSLSTRSGQQAAPLELLRAKAQEIVAGQTVRSLRPDRYQVAERTAAGRVEKALAAGDARTAFVEKQKQLLNHELFRAAQEAADQSEAAFERLKALAVDRGTRERIGKAGGWAWTVSDANGSPIGEPVDSEDAARARAALVPGATWERTSSYLDQIDALLERYEFKRVSGKAVARRASLSAWLREMEDAGESVAISDALRDGARAINWKDLSVQELRDLDDATASIAHLARFKNRLMREQQARDFDALRSDLLAGIETNVKARPPVKDAGERTRLDDAKAKLDGFLAAHRKLSSLARQADGGASGGVWWDAFVRPLNEAANREVTMRAEAAAAQQALWSAWAEDGRTLRQTRVVPGVGSMSTESRLAVALNWGNEGNRARLLEGKQWSEAQGQAVIDSLDAVDWALVQGVWDHINSYWPEAKALEQRMNGVAPEKVEAAPFKVKVITPDSVNVSYRTIRGGYYPVAYDPAQSPRSAQQAEVKAAALYHLGKASRASTRAGSTKERTQGTGQPLLLSIDPIAQHLGEIIHDITHREVVRDYNKLIRDQEVALAIQNRLGPAALQQMRQVIEDVAVADLADNQVDRYLRAVRNGVSIATMGFNLQSAAMQVTGIGQSMQLVGVRAFARAAKRMFAAQDGGGTAFALVESKSAFMRTRATTQLREVSEALNQVKRGAWRDNLNRYAYWLMATTQRAVDTPTWLAAYETALEAEHDEAAAIAIADQAVIDTQGSGLTKDLAGVQRSRALNIFTVYYSYFSALHNRTANAWADFRRTGDGAKLAADFLLLYSLPAAMSVLIRTALKGLPDDEDEREGLGMKLVKEHISTVLGSYILVRDLGGAVTDSFDYKGPAGTMGFEALARLITQAKEGDLDAGLVEAAAKTVGILGGLPVVQATRSIKGLAHLLDGEATLDLRPLLFGPPPKR